MYTGLDGTYAKFSRDELACLWYNTLLVLPSNCTFTALREYMEMTGEILELDDSQKECISAAFAAAGIRDQEESGTYHTDSSLFVYDAKGDLYDNYTVSITGEEYTGIFKWGWFKSDFSLSRTVTTPNEVPVILPKGNYKIVITDNNDETLSQSRDVQIRPNSKNKEILFVTKFGGSEESLQSTAEYVPSKEEEVFKTSDLPDEAVEFNSHYYYVYDLDTVTTWEEAKEYCESQGGYLATITSQEEDEFVYSCLRNKFDCESAYFGFTDQNEEGTWVWANGEVSSYTNWHSGEPNSENPNEDFAMYYYKYSDGSWNDGDFGDRTVNSGRAFICEWGDYNTSNTISMSNITSVKASSSLSEYGMTHFPEYSIDNDVTTGWVEGVEGQGEGESLEFVFDNIYLVNGINIRAGYHKSESLFEKNSKPALIKIVFSDGSYQEYELKESFSNQKINFTQAKETTSITIVIESVYPGSEFEDTVISEIELY